MYYYCANCERKVEANEEYRMLRNRETGEKEEIFECECGGHTIIYGAKLNKLKKDENKNILCSCGGRRFDKMFHMNCTNKGVTSYKCKDCNEAIGLETYKYQEFE